MAYDDRDINNIFDVLGDLIPNGDRASTEQIKRNIELTKKNGFVNEIQKFLDEKGQLLLIDLDDVLVNFSIYFFAKAVLKGFIDEKQFSTVADVLNRREYYINGYFTEKAKEKYTEEQMLEYLFYGDIYDNMIPNFFALNIYQNRNNIPFKIITHVHPLTVKSKKRFCEKYFPGVEVFYLELGQKKSDCINKNGLWYYTSFIDDNMENIKDVIKNTISNTKEFFFPEYGYNIKYFDLEEKIVKDEDGTERKIQTNIDPELHKLIEEKNIAIRSFTYNPEEMIKDLEKQAKTDKAEAKA